MKFLSKPHWPAAGLSSALAALGLGLPPARACGPFFPNTYLAAPESQLLAAPQAFFAEEMWRLAAPGAKRPGLEADPTRDGAAPAASRTEAIDLAELEAVLREEGRPEAARRALVTAYGEARKKGEAGPEGLPAEFAAYWRGALAWKRNQVAEARAAWAEVLALPEAERRHRATWAAYMLGRSHLDLPADPAASGTSGGDGAGTRSDRRAERDPDEALRWFRRTRELAATGSADVLGLAGEARGWEARILAERGSFADAIRIYLERLAAGDRTAVQSLRVTAARLVREADAAEFDRGVCDPQARAVAVAWLLARGGTFLENSGAEAGKWEREGESPLDDQGVFWAGRAKSWALAIHQAGGRGLAGAERLAWLAYEGGLFALAQDWLKLARDESAEADWLRAKLALRGGALEEGARWLERTAGSPGLNDAHRPQVYAELARTRMAQDQPRAALAAWLAGGHWRDAAFVAERVLTIDELAGIVDAAAEEEKSPAEDPVHARLRHLLARRMARAGEERAERYFPGELRGTFAAYRADVRTGFDVARPEKERAAAFWRAARIMKEKGAGLIGTELEPDWEYWGGSFDFGSAAEDRTGVPALMGGAFAPTEKERVRLEAHKVPEKRFHYRYRAAELAWWAASLLPGDSDETAAILCEAGGWLKAKDAKAAEPFYQALVIRCGRTRLGREAARLHWFPKDAPPANTNPD